MVRHETCTAQDQYKESTRKSDGKLKKIMAEKDICSEK